jgi:hypothetical protein
MRLLCRVLPATTWQKNDQGLNKNSRVLRIVKNKFLQEGNIIKIVRKASMCRKDIAPADYDAFKKFFKEIVEAESKYLVFNK